jgi:hypothetical protein
MNSNILSYYRDCYKEDSAELNLWNVSKLKKEDRLILMGSDDLGSGLVSRLPIPEEFARQMMPRVELYQRERVLLYVSFMLVGHLDIKGESKPVVAPLLFNEAQIELDGDHFYFAVDAPQPEVNESLTQTLMPESKQCPQADEHNSLMSPSLWTSWLKESPFKLNLLQLLNFPRLDDADAIAKALKSSKPSLLPVSMLVFVERSTSSRGVLHEIEEIIDANQLSPPLRSLLGEEQVTEPVKSLKYDYLPGLLSTPQKKVISIAANVSLGCVSGPPGTGKSYTIAAVAAEHMARGQSVLIVASKDAALDVIAEKLDSNFGLGDVSIRAGQKVFLKQLKSYIADLLSGYFSNEAKDPAECELQLTQLNKQLTTLETRFIKFCQKSIIRGQRLRTLELKEYQWLKRVYLRLVSGGVTQLIKQWSSLAAINTLHVEREALAGNYLNSVKNKNLNTLIETRRKSLQAFNKAIRSRTSKRQFELFDDIEYPVLLAAFPVWLVSLNTLYRVLPLKREMFDLVIIDEATQCNISSSLPALYRAKRAIVVGDTKQLKHFSFLAKSKEFQLMQKYGLSHQNSAVVSYRENSILDLTLGVLSHHHQLAFLDEHFRSKPELIHFSNQLFYQGKLKVMQHRPCTRSGHLSIQRVQGVRDTSGVNIMEAEQVITSIKQQILKDSQTGIVHSMGVISPFSDQANFIMKLIAGNFSEAEVSKHRLRSATPYGFQGEERDIMLISFCIDNDARRAAVYLNKADVFNVAVTRARQRQELFISIDETQLPETNLLRRYINSIKEFEAKHSVNALIDGFQQQVIQALESHGVKTWSGYAIAGTEIDILCRYQGQYLALDLIGYPGPWSNFFELNTYKLFKRVGIEVLPVSYGLWLVQPQSCIEKVLNMLAVPEKIIEAKNRR